MSLQKTPILRVLVGVARGYYANPVLMKPYNHNQNVLWY